jgi:DsbC/DsbD-like thiol-disulfide interchange protein
MLILFRYVLVLIVLLATQVHAQPIRAPHSSAELVSEYSAVLPGQPFRVAIRLVLDSGWHTYWRNPGDAGIASVVQFELPDGFTASDLQWPNPTVFGEPPEVTYGHEGILLLPVVITPAPTQSDTDTIRIRARASWLVCLDKCIPASARLELALPVAHSDAGKATQWTGEFHTADERAPRSARDRGIKALRVEGGYHLIVTDPAQDGKWLPSSGMFFASDESVVDHSAGQAFTISDGVLTIQLRASPYESSPPSSLRGVLIGSARTGSGETEAILIDVPIIYQQ